MITSTSLRFLSCLTLAAAVSSCSVGNHQNKALIREAWDGNNDPANMGGFDYRLANLPTSGHLKKEPWSDTYWPSYKGGIAVRWNATSLDSRSFSYATKSVEELASMSASEINQLSPAEKYDILRGRYDYPTVARERARNSPDAEHWVGICHGWSPAALKFEEPNPVTLTNSDGISIPFGSSDVKAMLSLYGADNTSATFIGSRCNVDFNAHPEMRNRSECRDTNAGSFHVAISNLIGVHQMGFVFDVTRDIQVWNQPVYGYRSQIAGYQGPSVGAAAGTVREAHVITEVLYVVEASQSTQPFGEDQSIESVTYDYRLELDANGEIIGGEWLSDDRPDFLWLPQIQSLDSNSALGKLYAASTNGAVVDPEPIPLPTAEPRPTAVPVPTAAPGPVNQPIPGSNAIYCADGFIKGNVAGHVVCVESNGPRVRGPFSDEMSSKCSATYFASYCRSNMWPAEVFGEIAGSSACITGTKASSVAGVCVDSAGNAYGPFTNSMVAACFAAGFDKNTCADNRWTAQMFNAVAGSL